LRGSLRELEAVAASEHWDPLSLWRYIELKGSLDGVVEDAAALAPWRQRLAELQAEPDAVDHLLAEVETAFEEAGGELPMGPTSGGADRLLSQLGRSAGERSRHTVRTADGEV